MLQSPKQGGSQVITATWIPFLTATRIFRDVAMIFYTSGTKVTLFVVICEFTSGIFTPSLREWYLFPSGTKTPTPYLALYDSLLPCKNHHCLPPPLGKYFRVTFSKHLLEIYVFFENVGIEIIQITSLGTFVSRLGRFFGDGFATFVALASLASNDPCFCLKICLIVRHWDSNRNRSLSIYEAGENPGRLLF